MGDRWARVLSPQERLQVLIDIFNEIDVLETCLLRATTAMETIDEGFRELDEHTDEN